MRTGQVRYARSHDVSIAYEVTGDGPADVILVPGIVSHVEAFHDLPGYTAFLESIASHARVIAFDKRGNGLSDRVRETPSLEVRMDDLRAVLDACRSPRATVVGISEGAPMALLFAASHPERTLDLFVFGGFARLIAAADHPEGVPRSAYERFTRRTVRAWGTGKALVEIFGPSLGRAPAIAEIAARCERSSATPTTLGALWAMNESIDVRAILPRVSTDVSVMHRADDRVVPARLGRALAAALPRGRFVELPGNDHLPFAGDFGEFAQAIVQALRAARPDAQSKRLRRARPGSFNGAHATEVAAGSPRPSGERQEGWRRLASGGVGDNVEIGRFVVQRSLGRGATGAVYLALDRDLGRAVALKVLQARDEPSLRRFRREAIAVARLSHPNVVQIHELGLDAEVPYLVLEYARGGSASDLAMETVGWARACRIVLGAARGLGAAHALGIVHRDVKPANLLLTEPGGDFVKVADFGAAKLGDRDPMTDAGAIIGTVGYLSPEQARAESLDARSDLYSLAATWYTLLAGRPFLEGSPGEVLLRSGRRAVPDPWRVRRDMPRALSRLVGRLGALDPRDRPADGAAAADEIEDAMRKLDGHG